MRPAHVLWLASSVLPAVLVGGSLCDATGKTISISTSEKQLISVQVLFRHGARTPLTDHYWRNSSTQFETGTLCGDLIKDKVGIHLSNHGGGPRPFSRHDAQQARTILPGGCSKGELTLQGQQQALSLGVWLRHRYMQEFQFLPPDPPKGAIAGRTTNYRRTIGTLELLVAGLMQKADDAVQITTASDLDEILFCNVKRCAQLGPLMSSQREAITSERGRAQEVRQLASRVRDVMQLPADHDVAFVELHDALTTLRFHDKALPGPFDDQLLLDIEKEAARRMLGMIAPDSKGGGVDKKGILRLGVGRLTAEILRHMDEACAGRSNHLMYLYSGHDTTIMPVLRALGVTIDGWPGYCSNIIFELWKERSQGGQVRHVVRVLYQQKPLQFPGSDEDGYIDLEDLRQGTFGQYATTTEEFDQVCRVPVQQGNATGKEGGDAIQGL